MKLLSVVCAAALAAMVLPASAIQVAERGAWPDGAAHCLFGDGAAKQPLSAYSRRAGLGLRYDDEPVFSEGAWHKASAVASDAAMRAKYQSAMEAEAAEFRTKLEPVAKSFDGVALAGILDEIKEQSTSGSDRVKASDPVIRDWLVRVEFLNELNRSVIFNDDCGSAAQAKAMKVARTKVAQQKECIVQGIHRSASLRPAVWVCDGATFNLN